MREMTQSQQSQAEDEFRNEKDGTKTQSGGDQFQGVEGIETDIDGQTNVVHRRSKETKNDQRNEISPTHQSSAFHANRSAPPALLDLVFVEIAKMSYSKL